MAGVTARTPSSKSQLYQCLFYTMVDKFRKEFVEKRPDLHPQVLISNTLHQFQEEMYLGKRLSYFLKSPAITYPTPGQSEVPLKALAQPADSNFWELISQCKVVSWPLKSPGNTETVMFALGNDLSASSAVTTMLEDLELVVEEGGPQDSLADPMLSMKKEELGQLFEAGSCRSCLQPDAGENHGLEITGSCCNAEELSQGWPEDATANLNLATPLWTALPQAELLPASTKSAKSADSFFGRFKSLDSSLLCLLAGDDLFSNTSTLGFKKLMAEVPSTQPPSADTGDPAAPCNAVFLRQHRRDWHDLDTFMELLVGS